MGGSDYTQQKVHLAVLEAITAAPIARRKSWLLVRAGFGIAVLTSLLIIFIAIASKRSVDEALKVCFFILLASFPFTNWIQSLTTRFCFKRENLRTIRFAIGHHEYQENLGLITDEYNKTVPTTFHQDLELFSIAYGLVSENTTIKPIKTVAAWQWFGTLPELPGTGIGITTYGPVGQNYAFIYGDPDTILKHSVDIWDLGLVRRIADSDKQLFKSSQKKWKRSGGTPVALAFASLPIDTDVANISTEDVVQRMTLLGLVNIYGSRDKRTVIPLNPSTLLTVGGRSSFVTSLTLILYGFFSYALASSFSAPMATSLLVVISLKFIIEALPVSAMAWDGSRPPKLKLKSMNVTYDLVWQSMLVAALGLTNFVLYFGRHGSNMNTAANQSIVHTGAMAAGFATVSFCLLASLLVSRGRSLGSQQFYNPLFWLGFVSSILIVLFTVLLIGPLLPVDWAYVFLAIVLFIGIREIQTYANNHHTRDHILELIKAS